MLVLYFYDHTLPFVYYVACLCKQLNTCFHLSILNNDERYMCFFNEFSLTQMMTGKWLPRRWSLVRRKWMCMIPLKTQPIKTLTSLNKGPYVHTHVCSSSVMFLRTHRIHVNVHVNETNTYPPLDTLTDKIVSNNSVCYICLLSF